MGAEARGGKATGNVPTLGELMADEEQPGQSSNGKGKDDDSGGCCGCLILIVVLVAAVVFFDPGFFDRVRGVSPRPVAQVSVRATSTSRPTRTPRVAASPVAQTYYVTSGRAWVFVRSCPGTDKSGCAELHRLERGSRVAVLGEVQGELVQGSSSWSLVTLPGVAREAYIHSPLLGPSPPTPLVPTATPRPTEVVVQAPETRAEAPVPPTATPQPQPQPQPVQQQPAAPAGEQARVVWITDGDSIEVEMNGQRFRVRYIGINTPERDESCSDAAKDANARLVNGRTVTMVRDVSNTDRYGRLLRYIYVGNTHVNEVLVRDGFAENSVWSPDTRFAHHFRALEAEARAAGRGCHPTGVFNDGDTER